MKNQLEIRTIHDIQDNIYDIFEVMYFDKRIGRWRGITTFFSLEEALIWYPNVDIIDKRKRHNRKEDN